MKSKNLILISLVFVTVILSSCAQLSSFQTGRTMEAELAEIGVSIDGVGIYDPKPQGGEIGSGVLPNLTVWARTALTDNFEMGLGVSSGLNAKIDGRYQLLGDKVSPIAGAIGLGYEYQFSTDGENTMVHRAHLPIYISYHPGLYDAFYATPRYSFQYVNDSDDTHFIGTALGYQHVFANGLIWNAELSYFAPLTKGELDTHLFMLGTGLKLQFFR